MILIRFGWAGRYLYTLKNNHGFWQLKINVCSSHSSTNYLDGKVLDFQVVSWVFCSICTSVKSMFHPGINLYPQPDLTELSAKLALNYSFQLYHTVPLRCSKKSQIIINTLRPSDAYLHQETGSSLVQTMACRLDGAKSLSEPMLDYCWLDP